MSVEALQAMPAVAQPGRFDAIRGAVSGFMEKAILRVGVPVGAIALVASGCSGGHAQPGAGEKLIGDVNTEACAQGVFSPESGNPDKYVATAFLPQQAKPVSSKGEAAKHVASWFDADGPLGTKIDSASLAAIQATIVGPAHDGEAVNPKFDYLKAFSDAAARYAAPQGGLEAARKDCATTAETLVQTGDFNGEWAQPGETITRIVPVRDANNKIIGMKLEKVVTEAKLGGVDFQLRQTSKGLDGFTDVLVTQNGTEYVKGLTVGEGGTAAGESQGSGQNPGEQSDTGASQRDQQSNTGAGNRQQQGSGGASGSLGNTGNGAGTQANGGGSQGEQAGPGQGQQNTGGAAGPNGTNPEAGPGGTTNSPGGGGGENTGGGETGGCQNCNGTGCNVCGGTGTTVTTRPTTVTTAPPTTGTTAPPTTGTTAPPPVVTTAPPPSTPPPTKGTVPCDPNIARC